MCSAKGLLSTMLRWPPFVGREQCQLSEKMVSHGLGCRVDVTLLYIPQEHVCDDIEDIVNCTYIYCIPPSYMYIAWGSFAIIKGSLVAILPIYEQSGTGIA